MKDELTCESRTSEPGLMPRRNGGLRHGQGPPREVDAMLSENAVYMYSRLLSAHDFHGGITRREGDFL